METGHYDTQQHTQAKLSSRSPLSMTYSPNYAIHIFWLLAANCCHDLWKVAMLQTAYTLNLDCTSYFQVSGFLVFFFCLIFVWFFVPGFFVVVVLQLGENSVCSSARIISVSG